MPKLFLAYLGGQTIKNRIGEDHETVLLIAEDREEAKKKARAKWQGVGAAHLDVLVEIESVDNYTIELKKTAKQSKVVFDDNWKELNPEA